MKKPLDNFNACDDFFVLVVKAHILVAAMKTLGMNDVNATPSSPLFPDIENEWMEPAEHRRKVLEQMSMTVVNQFVDFQFNCPDDCPDDSFNSPDNSFDDSSTDDGVLLYAKRLLALGCFYLEYSDGIREGDGDRVLRCWRYMLPMFQSSGRKNYALESLNLLFQHDFSLSPRQAAELVWSRFVNVRGLPGKNIPNDLHMEHLNRLVKTSLKGLGANKTEKAISTIGKVLGVIQPVLQSFDTENQVVHDSGVHRMACVKRDMAMLLKELKTVFSETPGRQHVTFKKPRDPLHHKTIDELKKYITDHIKLH